MTTQTPTAAEAIQAATEVVQFDGKGGWYAIDSQADVTARYVLATVKADNTLTSESVLTWSRKLGIKLIEEDVNEIVKLGNRDPSEGAEWLPYYKAALGQLALLAGGLSQTIQSGDPPSENDVQLWQRTWQLHRLLCGVGPMTYISIVAEMVEKVKNDDCFDWAEQYRDKPSSDSKVIATVHADGDQPADTDWFAGLPGAHRGGERIYFYAGPVQGCARVLKVVGIKVDLSFIATNERWVRWNPTRGQVRLACLSMGHTLAEVPS